ncbi:hypothetical protein [Waltera intestinalis]|uniref:Uncharacterized protein n=1 Tax=Waltera intestinalis TaxID=2606635 RepID=A0A6L5YGC0_9FIRM|nr:hypothetical protein [Waltera intestinalis]MST57269.1 hypothetical protein [Waltera intestinalis]
MTENEAIARIIDHFDVHHHDNRPHPLLDEAVGMAIKALEEVQQYRQIGTVEECREAVDKQTAISIELIEGKYFCPKCHNLMPYPGYCGCWQKVY